MTYHPVTHQITSLLSENGCDYQTFEHGPVRTSEEAARARPGYTLRQGAKAIIVRVKPIKGDKRYVMLVFPADRKFDSKKAKSILESKEIRFATENEIFEVTGGVEVGAVPPFGNLFGLPVVVDEELFTCDRIVFNAGDRRFSVAMASKDYRDLIQPTIADIT